MNRVFISEKDLKIAFCDNFSKNFTNLFEGKMKESQVLKNKVLVELNKKNNSIFYSPSLKVQHIVKIVNFILNENKEIYVNTYGESGFNVFDKNLKPNNLSKTVFVEDFAFDKDELKKRLPQKDVDLVVKKFTADNFNAMEFCSYLAAQNLTVNVKFDAGTRIFNRLYGDDSVWLKLYRNLAEQTISDAKLFDTDGLDLYQDCNKDADIYYDNLNSLRFIRGLDDIKSYIVNNDFNIYCKEQNLLGYSSGVLNTQQLFFEIVREMAQKNIPKYIKKSDGISMVEMDFPAILVNRGELLRDSDREKMVGFFKSALSASKSLDGRYLRLVYHVMCAIGDIVKIRPDDPFNEECAKIFCKGYPILNYSNLRNLYGFRLNLQNDIRILNSLNTYCYGNKEICIKKESFLKINTDDFLNSLNDEFFNFNSAGVNYMMMNKLRKVADGIFLVRNKPLFFMVNEENSHISLDQASSVLEVMFNKYIKGVDSKLDYNLSAKIMFNGRSIGFYFNRDKQQEVVSFLNDLFDFIRDRVDEFCEILKDNNRLKRGDFNDILVYEESFLIEQFLATIEVKSLKNSNTNRAVGGFRRI